MLAFLALAATGAWAQSRQEQAGRVIKNSGGPSAACALLSNDEVVRITGRRSYTEPEGTQLTNGGSACDYDSANVTVFSGPKSEEHYDALLKNFGKEQTPRQPMAGLGDRAYVMYPKPRDKHEGTHAVLVVRQGVHTLAVALETEGAETPQSLQPKLMAMAKLAIGRLR
jgi:hypothetical protein